MILAGIIICCYSSPWLSSHSSFGSVILVLIGSFKHRCLLVAANELFGVGLEE